MPDQMWHRIKQARTHIDKTQQEFADLIGVSRVTVGYWEAKDQAKRKKPSDDSLAKIAEVTGAPFNWLKGEGSTQPPGSVDAAECCEHAAAEKRCDTLNNCASALAREALTLTDYTGTDKEETARLLTAGVLAQIEAMKKALS